MRVEDFLTDADDEDGCPNEESSEFFAWGCLFPGRCIIAGEHMTCECMTAEEMEQYYDNIED